jgi:hypothetical protein
VNESDKLIYYKLASDSIIRSINSIQSYTNHNLKTIDKWPIKSISSESKVAIYSKSNYVKNKLSTYTFGKISLGLNLASLLSATNSNISTNISSNLNVSFYGQYNFNKDIGIRLPIRIGFNQAIGLLGSDYYSYQKHSKDLFYEVGIESVIMADDNRKANLYFLPGIYYGKTQGISHTFDTNHVSTYFASTPRNYIRVAGNVGYQFNFSRNIQCNLEIGLNINNIKQYYSYYSDPNPNPKAPYRIGFQGAINLVYRFGGVIRKTS